MSGRLLSSLLAEQTVQIRLLVAYLEKSNIAVLKFFSNFVCVLCWSGVLLLEGKKELFETILLCLPFFFLTLLRVFRQFL